MPVERRRTRVPGDPRHSSHHRPGRRAVGDSAAMVPTLQLCATPQECAYDARGLEAKALGERRLRAEERSRSGLFPPAARRFFVGPEYFILADDGWPWPLS